MFTSQSNTGFGITTTPSFGANNIGFGGANTVATSAPTSSLFSQPSAGFGATTQTATSTAGNAFNFGGFGATNLFGTSNTGGFGTMSNQQAQTGSFGMFNNSNNLFNQKRTFTATGLQSQQPLSQQPTLTLTLNIGTTSTTSAPATTTTATSSTDSSNIGLGGASLNPSSSTAADGVKGNSVPNNKSYRDQLVPPELIPLVENMKNFLEKQKQIRDENSHDHFYLPPILDIGNTIEEILQKQINKIEINLQKNAKQIEFAKQNTNKLLANGELVYRIYRIDSTITNSSLNTNEMRMQNNNFINTKTKEYFAEILENFKKLMIEYSDKIETLKSSNYYVNSINSNSNPNQQFSIENINQIIRKQHENFISIASKIYLIHEYANKLRTELAIDSNVNNSNSSENTHKRMTPNDPYGPTPFLAKSTIDQHSHVTDVISTTAQSAFATGSMFGQPLSSNTANTNSFAFGKNRKL